MAHFYRVVDDIGTIALTLGLACVEFVEKLRVYHWHLACYYNGCVKFD
jgi:hypothetical protein